MKNLFTNHEIFDRWSDYLLVAWWGLYPPKSESLLGRDNISKEEVVTINDKSIQRLLRRKKDIIQDFKNFLDRSFNEEEERKERLESKAHSLLGETGIVVSLLVAALSFGLGQSTSQSWQYLTICFLMFLILFNFVITGLHARNGVILKGYQRLDETDYLNGHTTDKELLLTKLYLIKYNNYLNDVKATYLRFAHWYFKAGLFFVIVTMVTVLTIFVLFPSNDSHDANTSNTIIYKNEYYKIIDSSYMRK